MRANEIFAGLKLFAAKLRLKQPGANSLVTVTTPAKNQAMAKAILRQQYGRNAIVSDVKELR